MDPSTTHILCDPSEWPVTLSRPKIGSLVVTYVFDSTSDIESFLKLIKEKFPNALVEVNKDDKGYTSITITQTPVNNASDDNNYNNY